MQKMSSRCVTSLVAIICSMEGVRALSATAAESSEAQQSIAITTAAALHSGRKVMRREDGTPHSWGPLAGFSPQSEHVAQGAPHEEDWQPLAGFAPQDIKEADEGKNHTHHHHHGHHHHDLTKVESPCKHHHCPAGKKLKPLAERPESCTGDECTPEECCVGMCFGFSCPANTTELIHDGTCSGYTCTIDQCCLGLCSQVKCPQHAVKTEHTGLGPKKCEGYVCAAEECCVGTCQGTTCPANSVELLGQPATCKGLPCEPDECCGGVCHESLCPSGKVPNTKMHLRLAASEHLRNFSTAPDCVGLHCEPEECCVGSCGIAVCNGTAPKRPLLVPGPSSCNNYTCHVDECCAGLCKHDDCAATEMTTFLKEDAVPCSAGVCRAEECCVGKCSNQSAVCSTQHGFTVHEEQANNFCAGIHCTAAECCAGTCSQETCGENYLLKQETSSCGTHVCSREECCLGQCTQDHCPREKGHVLSRSLPSSCSLVECTTAECCEALGTCSPTVCLPGNVTKSDPPRFCDGLNCTDAECCAKPGVCQSSICTSLAGFILKGSHQICGTDICTQEECCHQQRMIYWIEKLPGNIRGCGIFDQCNDGDIRTIRSEIDVPEGLAFDAKHNMLYWCDTGRNKILRCRPEDCSSAKTEVLVDEGDLHTPVRLTFDTKSSKLYWVEKTYQDIWRLDINTSAKKKVVYDDASDLFVDSVGRMLYWIDNERMSIKRCTLNHDFCEAETVMTSATDNLYGITVDAKRDRLFWGRVVFDQGLHSSRIESCPSSNCTEAQTHLVTEDVNLVRGLSYDAVSSTLYIVDSEEAGDLSKIRTCEMPGDLKACVNTHVFLKGSAGNKMSMPFAVAFDWTEETVDHESRRLPSWATESGAHPHVTL